MIKTLKEQALEATGMNTFKVLITTNKGSKEWSFISECIHLEMEAMKSQYPEGFTWDVLEFGKDII
mgnify:CR=1 FL=1